VLHERPSHASLDGHLPQRHLHLPRRQRPYRRDACGCEVVETDSCCNHARMGFATDDALAGRNNRRNHSLDWDRHECEILVQGTRAAGIEVAVSRSRSGGWLRGAGKDPHHARQHDGAVDNPAAGGRCDATPLWVGLWNDARKASRVERVRDHSRGCGHAVGYSLRDRQSANGETRGRSDCHEQLAGHCERSRDSGSDEAGHASKSEWKAGCPG
jgi:hypothetical protein